MCKRNHAQFIIRLFTHPAQIVSGRGHGIPADWWAFGVLLYEMLVGNSPFCDPDGGSQVVIYRSIIKGRYRLPPSVTNGHARDLITRLLVADPALRLTGEQVLEHPFFDGFDWEGLTSGRMPPPIRPCVATTGVDLRCFSSTATSRKEARDFAVGKPYNGQIEFEGF